MRVTITKPNVYNSYGIAMPVGSIQTVDSTFGASLVYALQATDTDGVLPPAANTPFSTTPTNTASAVAQVLKKHPFMPAGVQNVQQLIPATLFMGTANQTAASSTVTITAVTQGSLYIGSQLSGPGITAGTTVTAILTGNGGVGTVTVNNTTGFASTPLTAIGSAAPAVALSTTNPLAAGQQISPFLNSNGSVNLSFCSIMRGGNPVIAGTTNPNFNFVQFPTVSATAGGSGYVGGNSIQVGVMHTGLTIVLVLKGLSTNVTAKVNDQYVSLTPTAVPVNATINYYSLTFSTSAERRIDFIVDNVFGPFLFGGFFIGQTDTIKPATIRGRRVMIFGDSLPTGTGAASTALGFPGVFAEYLGWDDVWQSGIGGTGLINPGSYCTYGTRVLTDIVPFAPDEVIIEGFFNDGAFTGAQIQAALIALIASILSYLPTCRITVFGPYVNSGPGYWNGTVGTSGFNAVRAAIANAVAAFPGSASVIDPTSLGPVLVPMVTTLTSSPGASATTFTAAGFVVAGSVMQFPDGSRCFVRSRSGFTATVDRVVNAQTSGATITQVANTELTGNGNIGAPTGVGNCDVMIAADGIHRSSAGHLCMGLLLGAAYVAQLNA